MDVEFTLVHYFIIKLPDKQQEAVVKAIKKN